MKITIEDDKYIFYINKEYQNIKITQDKKKLARYFKELIAKLKNKYNIDIYGYYEINLYQDNIYGSIVELEKISDDYFDLFNQNVELKIICHEEDNVLFKIKDFYFSRIPKGVEVYYYQDYFYLKINNISTKFKYKLLEHSNIIYGSKVDEIIKSSSKII